MRLAWVFTFLIILLGSSAIAAHAQTLIPPPGSPSPDDPKWIFPDACPTGATCSYITTTVAVAVPDCTFSDTITSCLAKGLFFPLASPIAVGPSSSSLWYCNEDPPWPSGPFDAIAALGTTYILGVEVSSHFAPQIPGETGTFTGCEYWSGNLSASTTYGVAAQGGTGTPTFLVPEGFGFENAGDPIFPEPRTSLLFMSGIVLIALGSIARKRLGTTSRS